MPTLSSAQRKQRLMLSSSTVRASTVHTLQSHLILGLQASTSRTDT
jgi:hypothetical protein